MTENTTVVVVKNYDLRRRIVALTVVPALLLASLIVAIPMVFTGLTNVTITVGLVVTIIAEILTIIWALWFAGFLKDWPKKFHFNNFKWRYILLGVAAGQVFYWGLQAIASLLAAVGSPVKSSNTALSLDSLHGSEAIIVLLLLVPFVGPFIEEFLFRGVIITSLRNSKWKATWLSILVSAVSFGIMHIQGFSSFTDLAIAVWITIMGGVFAYLYIKTESFWTVFAAHAVYNLTSSILMLTGLAH